MTRFCTCEGRSPPRKIKFIYGKYSNAHILMQELSESFAGIKRHFLIMIILNQIQMSYHPQRNFDSLKAHTNALESQGGRYPSNKMDLSDLMCMWLITIPFL